MAHNPLISLLAVLTTTVSWPQSVLCGFQGIGSYIIDGPDQAPLLKGSGNASFSDIWQVLGPFRTGTREAIWGADPLEYHGGFHNLSYNAEATFSSALTANGTVKWSLLRADISNIHPGKAGAKISLSFPEIDWALLQYVYGWSALQYQSWARGVLEVSEPNGQTIALFVSGLLEFSVDGKRYFGGDFYNYRRVPVILHLSQGQHIVNLRLIRDVRVLGATSEPTIEIMVEAEERRGLLSVDQGSLLVSDISLGKLGNSWASIDIQNNMAEWIEVLSVNSPDASQHVLNMERLHIYPYQIRPLIFNITLGAPMKLDFTVTIAYRIYKGSGEVLITRPFPVKLVEKTVLETQKVTFLHPAKIVSYAILRPPPPFSICAPLEGQKPVPVMIGLHGAGLDAESAQVREMLDAAYNICSWKLFPTGVTPWGGDDWHYWGSADVQAAVATISDWTKNVNWGGPGVALDDWILVGHSNGGQGVWFLSTHYPDSVIAAAPVSGYSSIESMFIKCSGGRDTDGAVDYVPYSMWQESDPIISSILQKSRSNFKHELLLGNVAGIPILQQHGSDDDNVPTYHSRLMHELLEKTQWPSQYDELPGKGHWFEGILTTPPLLRFYEENVISPRRLKVPSMFTISIPSSGDIGSIYGIHVDQLQSPDLNGQIKVIRDLESGVWHLQTQNIYRFHLSASPRLEMPNALVLDNIDQPFIVDPGRCEETWYLKIALNRWIASTETTWKNIQQRYGRQMGAMDAILRSSGTFTIYICSSGVEHTALQISRNLLQYFAADSQIIEECIPRDSILSGAGNTIILAIGDDLPPSRNRAFPIRTHRGNLVLSKGCIHHQFDFATHHEHSQQNHLHDSEYIYEDDLGALFLRPLEDERLELIVWGADLSGLEQAARLVPTLTGVGQPDFLVLSHSCRWKGHGGLYAAGHFNKFWQISPGSYISKESKN